VTPFTIRQPEPAPACSDDPLAQRQRAEIFGLLAAGLTHDLHQALASIGTLAERAESQLPPAHPARTELARVRSAAQRANRMSRRALQFGQAAIQERAPLNLVALMEEALPLLRVTLPRQVELHPHFEISAGDVCGEPNQLLHLFFHLTLAAARSFGDDGGTIEVRVSRQPAGPPPAVSIGELGTRAHLCLSVMDTRGLGDDDGRTRSPQVNPAASPVGGGLDPAVVRQIVRQHEGGIAIESLPGRGRRIRVYLPETIARPSTPASAAPARGAGGARHIAVIDDEETVVRLAEQALQFAGFRVTVIDASSQCLANCLADPGVYDLIMTDQRMPGLSGFDLLRQLRAAGQSIPVVITSGSLAAVSLRELQAVAPARFLPKPFTLSDLLGVVRELLERRSAAKA
jgi:CheY-like chemotaxis protein